MKLERVYPVLTAVVFWAVACGGPRLQPEGMIDWKFPLTEASRMKCRGPLIPKITAGPGGLILVETRTGYLQALDPEKTTIRWTSFVGAGAPAPVVVGDRIVCALKKGGVIGLDEAGQETWRLKLDKPVRDDLRVVGGRVVFRNAEGFLTALNPADGAIAWNISVPAAADWTAGGERIVLRTSDNRLLIFRPDGSPAGDYLIGGKAAGDIGLVENYAILGFAAGYIGAYDLTTGNKRWRQHLGGVPVGSPVSDGRNVYVVLSNQIMAAFHLRRGDLLYWRPLSGRAAFSPRFIGSTVFVSSRSPRLQAFSAKAGEVKVAFEGGGEILAPPESIGSKIILAMDGETEQEDILVSLLTSPPESPESPEKTEGEDIKKESGEIKK